MHERPADIDTPRLRLVALAAEEVRALVAGDTARASRLVGALFPAAWPSEAQARDGLAWHLQALDEDVRQRAWRIRVAIELAANLVVGAISLKGPASEQGDVEIGWGVDLDYRRRGFAVEAAMAVSRWVLTQPHVHTLSATIADDNVASQRLAARLGMRLAGGETRRGLPVWRSVRSRF